MNIVKNKMGYPKISSSVSIVVSLLFCACGCATLPAPIMSPQLLNNEPRYYGALSVYSGNIQAVPQIFLGSSIPLDTDKDIFLIFPVPGWPLVRGVFSEMCYSVFCSNLIIDASFWQKDSGISPSGKVLRTYGSLAGIGVNSKLNYSLLDMALVARGFIKVGKSQETVDLNFIPAANFVVSVGTTKKFVAELGTFYQDQNLFLSWTLGGQF